jgi:hypothetical protein
MDAKGSAAAALAIVDRRQHDADDRARICLVEKVDPLPLDPADRQVEEDVDDALQAEPFQRLGELRPDAFQHLHFGEQRIENVRSHH